MCYLIAKDPQKHGCYALKTVHGKHLAELKWSLYTETGRRIQLVTISRPTAYMNTLRTRLSKTRMNSAS